jgi:hypothetical protein
VTSDVLSDKIRNRPETERRNADVENHLCGDGSFCRRYDLHGWRAGGRRNGSSDGLRAK